MTKTPNLNLFLPDFNDSPWHDEVNNNFRSIDATIKSIFGLTSLLGSYQNSTAVTTGQRYFDETTGFYYEALSGFTTLASPNTFVDERTAYPARWKLLDASAAITAAAGALVSETNAAASAAAAASSQTAAGISQTAAAASAAAALVSKNAAAISETNAATSETNAALAKTAAETAETNAETAETNAETAQTAAELAKTAAQLAETNAANDAIATAADRVQTGLDVISTAADVVSTNSDVVSTNADAVATAADRIQTGLDAATTAQDVIDTGVSETNAAASAAAASATLATAVRGDIVQSLTAAQQGQARANIDAGIMSAYKNKLLNGDFRVTEAGASGTVAAGVTARICDQWVIINGTNQTLTWTVASSQGYARNRPENRIVISFAIAPTSGGVTLQQRIEDARTLAGKNVTLSLDVLDPTSNIIGTTAIINFEQFFGSGGSTTVYAGGVSQTVSAAGRQTFAHTIPSVVGKTINAGSWLAPQLTFEPRTAHFFIVAAIQLEEGPLATRFEERHIAQERLLCARYYQKGVGLLIDGNASITGMYFAAPALFPTPMRATPTVVSSFSGEVNVQSGETGVFSYSPLGAVYQMRSAAAGRFYTTIAAPVFDARL